VVWANIWYAVLACEAFDAGVKWEISRVPTEVLLSLLCCSYMDYTKTLQSTLAKKQFKRRIAQRFFL
jgi:hypothetical protein